ncbi:flagellar assembly peptidoglycan hydrolase FlgJ [Oxalobacteraceae bacterium R-40]|uniref:Peptidoglycan hydrolase FlgJ n=1 Tax=Keguizhuia sedimenti TaxID=3064264 RepID=A0ABU1BPG6_9BURK|nr:flagellar assembly peptidoglycan hydrolase FlgJ [Oxalobacteraceae bacterium R-40]
MKIENNGLSNGLSGQFAVDAKGMGELRRAAQQNSPDALKETAWQFEALFMNMVMKSMRQATPQDGVFDSEQSRMYTAMLDQQISQNLAKRGVGLADVLVRQLSSTANIQQAMPLEQASGASSGLEIAEQIAARMAESRSAAKDTQVKDKGLAATDVDKPARRSSRPAHVRDFQERLASHAEEASRTTGIPAKFMLGQAALESGWGKREIVAADGTRSHNLFGIKATSGWKGKVVEAVTTEYINGMPQRRVEKFRAYDSYADAFRDYARMLSKNPRYERVIANAQDATSFAQGLQRAGYATDPQYAAKLSRLIKTSFSV